MDLDYFVQKVKIVTKQEDGTYLYLGGVTDEEREARLREREEKAREDREARQKEREEKAREEGSRAGSMEEGVGIPHGQPIDIPHIEIRDMRQEATSSNPLMDILASLKRLEEKLEAQEAFNKKIEVRLDDQDEDLASLHQDLKAIHSKLDMDLCDHDDF